MTDWLLVGIGGMIGAVLRFAITKTVARYYPSSFPMGTLAVNLLGSFLLGWIITMQQEMLRILLGSGVMGALTTFSTYMVEANHLHRNGQTKTAWMYVGLSLAAGLLFAYAGYVFGRSTG